MASKPELPLLGDGLQSAYTEDGTVDFRSRPALRSRTGRGRACLFIIGYELVERVAYYGIKANLVLYIKNQLHEGTASASESVNNWVGACTMLPIFGALIADAYLGRFRTISYLSGFYVLGLTLLMLSASVSNLKPSSCSKNSSCPKATEAQMAFFYSSLYLIAIGTGGVKPCLEAFGADQFDEDHPNERKSRSSYFNWLYAGIQTGALLAYTFIVYIEDNASWGLGYGILAVLIVIASSIFLLGTPFYRNKIPAGSSLVSLCQVFVAALRKWRVVPSDSLLYEVRDEEAVRKGRQQLSHTFGLRYHIRINVLLSTIAQCKIPKMEIPGCISTICLDKAATMCHLDLKGAATSICSDVVDEYPDNENVGSPWTLCTVTQVEEAKLIVRIFPMWLSNVIYGLLLAQYSTFFVQQAETMNRQVGSLFVIPAGSLPMISSICILVVLPFYDQVLVPCTRLFTGHAQGFTMLQRIGIGYLTSVVLMITAALVERRRLEVAAEYGILDDPNATVPMSIFWLAPQYLMLGVADVFALIGEQEFFYDQVPDSMRSLGMALHLCSIGLSSYLGNAIISIVSAVTSSGANTGWFVDNLNRCHLDYYYWLLAVLFFLNFLALLLISWCYTYKEVSNRWSIQEREPEAI